MGMPAVGLGPIQEVYREMTMICRGKLSPNFFLRWLPGVSIRVPLTKLSSKINKDIDLTLFNSLFSKRFVERGLKTVGIHLKTSFGNQPLGILHICNL